MHLRNVTIFWIVWCGFSASVSTARGDGGAVCFSSEANGQRITVFAEPVPPRVGPLDLSVLVQELSTLQPLTDLQLDFTLTSSDRSLPALSATASAALATNRLFQAAEFELPAAGSWQVTVEVRSGGERTRHVFPLSVSPPRAAFWELVPWIFLPAIPIGIFFTGQLRRAADERRRQRAGVGG
jgi:hypothetical protein